MPYDPPDLAQLKLADIAALVGQRRQPPVETWDPPVSGDSEMRIAADGRWYHQGAEITRPAMIRAFSGLLRREEDDSYWLVTPQEKLAIIVEDAPFIAVEMQSEGSGTERTVALRLNSDDLVIVGPDHGIALRPLPYVHVRAKLWARLARPVYYELAEIALSEGGDPPGFWSSGRFFAIGDAA